MRMLGPTGTARGPQAMDVGRGASVLELDQLRESSVQDCVLNAGIGQY